MIRVDTSNDCEPNTLDAGWVDLQATRLAAATTSAAMVMERRYQNVRATVMPSALSLKRVTKRMKPPDTGRKPIVSAEMRATSHCRCVRRFCNSLGSDSGKDSPQRDRKGSNQVEHRGDQPCRWQHQIRAGDGSQKEDLRYAKGCPLWTLGWQRTKRPVPTPDASEIMYA
jgi:hypothetical protein